MLPPDSVEASLPSPAKHGRVPISEQKNRLPERWPSGRRRSPAKGVCGHKLHRGFESLSLRQMIAPATAGVFIWRREASQLLGSREGFEGIGDAPQEPPISGRQNVGESLSLRQMNAPANAGVFIWGSDGERPPTISVRQDRAWPLPYARRLSQHQIAEMGQSERVIEQDRFLARRQSIRPAPEGFRDERKMTSFECPGR